MEIKQLREGELSLVRVKGIELLDVGKTFDCGQCFRFDEVQNSKHRVEYAGVAFGRHVSFAQDGDELYIYNCDEGDFFDVWSRFLALDMDYAEINRDILSHSAGTVMDEAMEYGRGIRILRQDPFEATVSFIISQNNNIPRIKKIIESLCECCGEPIVGIEGSENLLLHSSGRSSMRSFPSRDAIAELGEEGLYGLRVGFRAKYINDAMLRLGEGSLALDSVSAAEHTSECIDALCAVKGIGLKVASCIALFGMGRYDAFPVDVWMKRVGEKYFSADPAEFSAERFGKYAGIAQQYLFYYERYHGGK